MKPHTPDTLSRRASLCRRLAGCALALACLRGTTLRADDAREAIGIAPPNHVLLREARGGAYYVTRPLKEDYDKLLAQARALGSDLDARRITGPDALAKLQYLRARLDLLSARIEHDKVLVSALKIHTERVETTFDLGPRRMLLITAGRVHVEGWDQPGVKCVLDKLVLSADDKPVDKQLQAIKLVHQLGPGPRLLEQPAPSQPATDDRLVRSEEASVAAFADGPVDTVQVDGLMDNLQLQAKIQSPNGGGSSSGTQWQRDADLTVYVPRCKALAVRGGGSGVDVRGLRAELLLVPGTAWGGNRHDDDTFSVRDLHGSLTSVGVTLETIESVHGDVYLTGRLPQTTASYSGDNQRTIFATPSTLHCHDIEGNMTAWFVRTDLSLDTISGRIDIRNDFGRTTLSAAAPLARKAHRILSESGRIEVSLSSQASTTLSVLALTNSGSVQTNFPREQLPDRIFALDNSYDPRRDWRGVASASLGTGGHDQLEIANRLTSALQGTDRPDGLDLITRDGTIQLQAGK